MSHSKGEPLPTSYPRLLDFLRPYAHPVGSTAVVYAGNLGWRTRWPLRWPLGWRLRWRRMAGRVVLLRNDVQRMEMGCGRMGGKAASGWSYRRIVVRNAVAFKGTVG